MTQSMSSIAALLDRAATAGGACGATVYLHPRDWGWALQLLAATPDTDWVARMQGADTEVLDGVVDGVTVHIFLPSADAAPARPAEPLRALELLKQAGEART